MGIIFSCASPTVWDFGMHFTVHCIYCNMLQLILRTSISSAEIANLLYPALGTRYFKSSGAAASATAVWQKK